MRLFPIFRQPLLAALPALLLAAACSKSDSTPAPDQGRVNAYHMAASANVPLKFAVDAVDKGPLNYNGSSGYQNVNVGSHTLTFTVAGGAQAASKPVTVEKGKSYSFFVYAVDAASADGLVTTDDLTAPAAATTSSPGKAKIRLVNLGQGTPSPLGLATTVAGVSAISGTEAAFGTASPFVEILPGSYNVAVTNGATPVDRGNVGDGSGAGLVTPANYTYQAGKIYTIIYRGLTGTLVTDALKPTAVLVLNN